MRTIGALLFAATTIGAVFEAAAADVATLNNNIQPQSEAAAGVFKTLPNAGPNDPNCSVTKKPTGRRSPLTESDIDALKDEEAIALANKGIQMKVLPRTTIEGGEHARRVLKRNPRALATISLQIDFCHPRQPLNVKFSAPFNPSYDTNVLKTNTNPHTDTSYGLGGNVLITSGGFNDYDVMGVSIGTVSSRYHAFPAKSVDVVTTQGVYQLFLGARGYNDKTDTQVPDINRNLEPDEIPPGGLITYDTLGFGLVNQTNYVPTFQTRASDLLSPQITLALQNLPLLDPKNNVCQPSPQEGANKKSATATMPTSH
jgi:hypothetical protein